MSCELLQIYLVAAAGGTPRPMTATSSAVADPSWSPDGRRLAFGSAAHEASTSPSVAIHLLDVATREVRDLPGSQGFLGPSFSPDGRFRDVGTSEIYALDWDALEALSPSDRAI